MTFEYPVIRSGVEMSLMRYHKGLLDACLDALDELHLQLLINDIPIIISRIFWPGLSRYSDFMDEGDFSKEATATLLYGFFDLPRCCDVIALYHIFWLGTGRSVLPAHLTDDVLYLNIDGLSKNITSETFTKDTLSVFEKSLSENNPVRKMSSLDTLTVTSLITRVKKGGSWNNLFQMICACILIALKGISRKVLQGEHQLPETITSTISPKQFPLSLHFNAKLGSELSAKLGEKQHLIAVHSLIIRLWEEYELCKIRPGCLCPEYPHLWFDFMQSCLPKGSPDKWNNVYYPKLREVAGFASAPKPAAPKPDTTKKIVEEPPATKKKSFKIKMPKSSEG